MAKNLPYFKFYSAEWLTGDIVYEDLETQGLFINICATYWHRQGALTIDDIKKRYKSERLANLTERFILVNDDGLIRIKFLDEQLEERDKLSKTNADNGKLGGRPKSKHIDIQRQKPTALLSVSEMKANESNIEEKRREEKRGEEEESTPTSKLINTLIDSKNCNEVLKKLKNDETFIDVLAKNNYKENRDIYILLDKFVFDNSGMHKTWANETDMRQHFRAWLPMHLLKNKPATSEPKRRVYE